MKKLHNKEKYTKMYLVMLCGLLVSGAIVCSTNDNGNGNGGGGDSRMFVCTNGTIQSGTTTMANVENCASCNEGFGQVTQDDGRSICQPEFTCPNGTIQSGTTTMAGEENCADCNTADGFTLEAVQGSDRMVCRTPYVCPNGTIESGTTTMPNEENCASCNAGFESEMQVDGRTICRAPYVCLNGTAVEGSSATMADVENCASCNTAAGFTLETSMSGSEMVCRTPYVCPNGDTASGTTTMANVENCTECDSNFGEVMQGERTTCQPEYVCTNGTVVDDTRPSITDAGVENCASCDPSFGEETQNGRTTCNALPIALWNAGDFQGNFGGLGLTLCQSRLDSTSDTIGAALTARGYTKAVFFGSRNTYDFPDIGSEVAALALPAVGGGSPVSLDGRDIVVFTVSGVNVIATNTFGSTPVTRTLGQVTNVTATGAWQNGGKDVIGAAGITNTSTRAWSFTNDREYAANFSCTGATSNGSDVNGYRMNSTGVDGGGVESTCNTTRFVLCVAR